MNTPLSEKYWTTYVKLDPLNWALGTELLKKGVAKTREMLHRDKFPHHRHRTTGNRPINSPARQSRQQGACGQRHYSRPPTHSVPSSPQTYSGTRCNTKQAGQHMRRRRADRWTHIIREWEGYVRLENMRIGREVCTVGDRHHRELSYVLLKRVSRKRGLRGGASVKRYELSHVRRGGRST